jgi:hypothetical protein
MGAPDWAKSGEARRRRRRRRRNWKKKFDGSMATSFGGM